MSESWYGWLRRDRRYKWQRVCGPYATLAECSRQLGAEAKMRGIPDRHTCITTGAYPRDVKEGIDAASTLAQETRSGAKTARPSGNYLGGF